MPPKETIRSQKLDVALKTAAFVVGVMALIAAAAIGLTNPMVWGAMLFATIISGSDLVGSIRGNVPPHEQKTSPEDKPQQSKQPPKHLSAPELEQASVDISRPIVPDMRAPASHHPRR